MATLPADLDAVTSLPTTITANVTAGHTGHSEIIHKALRAIETAWASLAETGALDAEAIRDLMGTVILGTGLITVTPSDPSDTVTITTTATANSPDATLLARANHTGTQDPATTLTAWVEAVVDAVAPALVSGVHTNISFAYDDAAGKINATAVGGSGGGPIPASSITDSTTFGRAVLTAVDAATARAAIGAGTSSLVIGTLVTQAKAGNYQPTAANISDGTVTGRSLVTAVDAAAGRTAIGLNTAGLIPIAVLPVGTGASQVSVGTHTHAGTGSDVDGGSAATRTNLIALRGGTAAAWTAANPVLGSREAGVETDTGKIKIGDGTTAWNALVYSGEVHAHANSDIPGLHAVATSGSYADLTGTPAQGTLRVYAVAGVYPTADAAVRVREFYGKNAPGIGVGQAKASDLWFKTAVDFPAP